MRPNSAILCFGLIVALLGNFVIATAASAACNIKSKVRELPTGSNFNPVHYGNCQDPQDQTCTNDPPRNRRLWYIWTIYRGCL